MIEADKLNPRLDARMRKEQEMLAAQEREQAEADATYLKKIMSTEAARTAEARRNVEAVVAIEREAEGILKSRNPFKYFLDAFKLDHEGDLTTARCITLVFAASSVANGDGLHAYLSGASGRGKSHSAETMFRQLPDEYRYNRSFSDRYLYYAGNDATSGLKEGVVVLVDDQTMSESVQELFKVSTSHYNDPAGTIYGTVLSQKAITLRMPPRISWVLLKVDDPGDDQVMNRLIQCRIDESEAKVRDSAKRIQNKYANLSERTVDKERREIQVCRSMWTRLKGERV
ncbi:MAG: hypothetical protein EHJ95_03910, partial [Methanobacteriota archaeon]